MGFEDSGLSKIAVASAAGATSALVSCPAECVMIQQQKYNRPLAGTMAAMYRDFGLRGYYRGIGPTMVRESLYSCGEPWIDPLTTSR